MVIAGRVADVDLALGHDDVRALAAKKAAERGGPQSRRLSLAKEGQIAEGSPAWEDMSAGDRAKRKRAAGALGVACAWVDGGLCTAGRLAVQVPRFMLAVLLHLTGCGAVPCRQHPHLLSALAPSAEPSPLPACCPASRAPLATCHLQRRRS